ncbi:hypothetical protein Taro_006861 [Colocasia esculenta]|uniref:EF-hand domain-containing protein n=1 Tax=Colocasia esculenta TaxID=4460 RepID=A0A843TYM6_COLES|nr:hypothetical protein [Colocasia esculenta]
MEGAQGFSRKPSLRGRPSASFRLRSSSLNAVRLRRIFDLFDNNGDGEITVAELSQVLDRLGLEAESEGLRVTVEAFIKPGHDGLEYDDFEGLHRSLGDAFFGGIGAGEGEEADAEEADLTEAFKVFDEDGDGFISARELQAVLGKLGLSEGGSITRVREMICSVDRNHDGRVDFYERLRRLGREREERAKPVWPRAVSAVAVDGRDGGGGGGRRRAGDEHDEQASAPVEEAVAQGRSLNREQEETLRSKPAVAALIEEYEKSRDGNARGDRSVVAGADTAALRRRN